MGLAVLEIQAKIQFTPKVKKLKLKARPSRQRPINSNKPSSLTLQ
jgi:hypothetical protein